MVVLLHGGIAAGIVGAAVVKLTDETGDWGEFAALLFCTLFPLGLLYLFLKVVVLADDRGLMVRNVTQTTRLPWNEVEDFRVGGNTGLLRSVVVLRRNGEVLAVGATERAWPPERFGPVIAELREWLAFARSRQR